MARASEKKAATLRANITSFYRPLLWIWNIMYVLIRYWKYGSTLLSLEYEMYSTWTMMQSIACIMICLGLQYYAYMGIIDDAERRGTVKKKTISVTSSSATKASSSSSSSLVGGGYLDLLGYVFLIQFGTLFVSTKVYYLFIMIPCYGLWYLCQTWTSATKSTPR